jgi:hypothetical protein
VASDQEKDMMTIFFFSEDTSFLAILIAGVIAFLAVVVALIHRAAHRRRMRGYNFTRMYRHRAFTPWNGLIPAVGARGDFSGSQESFGDLVAAEEDLVETLSEMLEPLGTQKMVR